MTQDDRITDAPSTAPDERSIARKYGIRELNWPDSEQVRALSAFLTSAIETGRCGPVPKTAVVVMLEFIQATINRQHITKGPRMLPEEFDALQSPYYAAARILAKIQRARQESSRGRVYQATWLSLNQFVELLRNILDPANAWLRTKSIPPGAFETMEALLEFLTSYSEQRRRARST